MKKLLIIFLFPLSLLANQENAKDVIDQNFHRVLNDQNDWLKEHKHEDVDALFWYRVGYLEACRMAYKALGEG